MALESRGGKEIRAFEAFGISVCLQSSRFQGRPRPIVYAERGTVNRRRFAALPVAQFQCPNPTAGKPLISLI